MKILRLPMRRIHMQRNLRGHGLGGLFARLATLVKPILKTAVRSAKPFVKQTLKQLGKQGIQAASSTISDVVEGVPLKQAAKRNAVTSLQKVKQTVKKGAKRAATASIAGVREDIKRRRQTGGAKQKTSARKRSISKRKPNRGIFQK